MSLAPITTEGPSPGRDRFAHLPNLEFIEADLRNFDSADDL
jgi:hypothetical protein